MKHDDIGIDDAGRNLLARVRANDESGFSRRDLIMALGAVATGAALPASALMAATTALEADASSSRIDLHHHFLPTNYIGQFRERLSRITDGSFLSRLEGWVPATAVEQMDKYGIATSIVSLPLPGVWTGDEQRSRKLARTCNEFGTRMAQDYPGRFGLFAALPLPDTDGSLRELEFALDVLKADGIGLLTSYGDKWTGDPSFDPVFEELNRRKAVVHVHPAAPNCCVGLVPGIPPSVMEYLFDTSRSISSLLFNGTFARYPDIRFIFMHAGGTMPVLAKRTEQFFTRHEELKEQVPHGVAYELNKLHYDIANATNPSSMAALLKLVPASQVLLGTDFPYRPVGPTLAGLDDIGLSIPDLRAINRDNAMRLFPRLAA